MRKMLCCMNQLLSMQGNDVKGIFLQTNEKKCIQSMEAVPSHYA